MRLSRLEHQVCLLSDSLRIASRSFQIRLHDRHLLLLLQESISWLEEHQINLALISLPLHEQRVNIEIEVLANELYKFLIAFSQNLRLLQLFLQLLIFLLQSFFNLVHFLPH